MALILDTGPLYASRDRSDADHRACRSLIESAELQPLVIPAPVLVEVDYWIHQRLHPGVLRRAPRRHRVRRLRRLAELVGLDYVRVRDLCDRYADADIGFVDAAVLAIVERLNEPKLATLDRRHFGLLRPRHRDTIEASCLPDFPRPVPRSQVGHAFSIAPPRLPRAHPRGRDARSHLRESPQQVGVFVDDRTAR